MGCHRRPENVSGVQFVDVAAQAGVARVYSAGGKPNIPLTILQTIGHGGSFLDFNRDGNLDFLLVDTNLTLYQGDGQGHFTDVTRAAGLDRFHGHFLGCTVADYDNDGYADLYISGYREGLLLHNEAGSPTGMGAVTAASPPRRRFRDVTAAAGLKPQRWGTSCGFVDLDNDGLLDLVIANYVDFGPDPHRYLQRCEPLACPPQDYNPERPTYYHNLGQGRFREETRSSGLITSAGKCLGIAFADYDQDGKQDILFANDEVAGDLFHNNGDNHLQNVGVEAGVAFGPEGHPHGGMGADWSDYDGDGKPDAVVTTYTNQPKSLYHNDGKGLFTDVSEQSGVGNITKPWVAFGVKWLDYDNDGWPDLMIANGNVDNNIAVMFPDVHYRQPTQLLRNTGGDSGGKDVKFVDVSGLAGKALLKPIVGRGLATGDFDNDGRIDVLLIEDEGPVLLLHNQGGKVGHWIGLSLIGHGRSNRDALGARVTVEAGGRKRVREVQTSGSYLSASDRRLLIGIGAASRIDKITLRWPDGREENLSGLAIDRYHTLQE
ncbi:MAG: UnbV, partial [Chthonomonadales bacterium]|nr:UnbV [Chthonomonadales bacterium]